jgi:2-methylcitrate dehydratase PrpD
MSAALAADGLTGTPHSLEGKAGFFALYMQGRVRPVQMTEGLGSEWRIAEYSLKPYPACRCNHGAIALGIQLHDEGLDPASVAAVEIRMSEANWTLVGKPYDAGLDSVVHAQFNAAYSFARALVDGRVGPRAYERPAIGEAAVVALAAKVRVGVDDAVPKDAMAPVRIDLRLVDGRTLTLSGNTLKGSRDEPMSEREVQDKLRGCFEFGMDAPASAADRLADAIFSLEHASDAAAAIRTAFPGP